MQRRLGPALLAAATIAALVSLAATPASAAPNKPKVSSVFELPCDSSVCESGNDSAASQGAVVEDTIQIHVSASSPIGLSSVELQARQVLGGDPSSWVCIKSWSTSATNFPGYVNWNTNEWPSTPSGCSDSAFHGDMTRNATYEFRVIARDATGSETSDLFSVKVSNGAQTPDWADEPTVTGAEERKPEVELRWKANPEPDIREYHFLRTAPDGDEDEFAVSASKPGGQGCSRDGDIYTCFDDDFTTEGFGGEYSYALIALRTSPSSRQSCSISPYGDCTESAASDTRSVSIDEPEPGPDAPSSTPTKSGSGGGGSTKSTGSPAPVRRSGIGSAPAAGSYEDFFSGEFDKKLPYDGTKEFQLPGGEGRTPVAIDAYGEPIFDTDTSGRQRAVRVLAGGLLMLLIAAHLARLLRDSAPIA